VSAAVACPALSVFSVRPHQDGCRGRRRRRLENRRRIRIVRADIATVCRRWLCGPCVHDKGPRRGVLVWRESRGARKGQSVDRRTDRTEGSTTETPRVTRRNASPPGPTLVTCASISTFGKPIKLAECTSFVRHPETCITHPPSRICVIEQKASALDAVQVFVRCTGFGQGWVISVRADVEVIRLIQNPN
jgi:hypothetical protein